MGVATPPPFLRRVQLALGVSAMELAHHLSLSIGEYESLAKQPRMRLANSDPMWLDIQELLDKRIGACIGIRDEVGTFVAGRR